LGIAFIESRQLKHSTHIDHENLELNSNPREYTAHFQHGDGVEMSLLLIAKTAYRSLTADDEEIRTRR